MQYTSNYNLAKPDGSDIINPASRTGYNDNFDTLDTTLKSVSDKADTNEGNITTLQGNVTTLQGNVTTLQGDVADLNAKTGEDIPFESGSADSISDKITNLDNSVGTKPSGETDTLWEKVDTLENRNIYSTTEQVIGKWIDGKPLYRKVIQTTLTGARNEINHSIANLKSVTKIEGFIVYNTETYHIPSWEDATKNAQLLNITTTKLVVTIGTGWSALYANRPCYVILEYTKTSD